MSKNDQNKNTPATFAGDDDVHMIQGPKLVAPVAPKVPQQTVEDATEIIAESVQPPADDKKIVGVVVAENGTVTRIKEEGDELLDAGFGPSKFQKALTKGKELFNRYKKPALIGIGVIATGLIARALVNSGIATENIEITDEPAYYDDADHADATADPNTEE